MSDVTLMLEAIAGGDQQAAEQLLPIVYDELRRLAAARMAEEKQGLTLQPTALVHEAYLRLTGHGSAGASPSQAGASPSHAGASPSHPPGGEAKWDGRGHFFAAAAEAMRRILIDAARKRKRLKRGGDLERVDLDEVAADASIPGEDLIDLDEALQKFTAEDPLKAELVRLRFYAGLSVEEAGECLGIARATADRYWSYARAWLYDRLRTP
jgi:RNA polymerase sigma factor (sigma-70 family)